MPGLNKPWQRVSSKLVDALVVKQGKAAGTVKGYAAMLSQADEWLPNQLKTLIEEQVNCHKALQTNGLPAEFTAHPKHLMKGGVVLPSHVIFPQISLATNLISPATIMSSENVQKMIDMFTQNVLRLR